MSATAHVPVMLEQAIDLLQPRPGGIYVDLTLGAGGHARRILECSAPDGRLLGLDRDPQAIELARDGLRAFAGRFELVQAPFSELSERLSQARLERVDGLLADLGVSSMQLDQARRGFSFQQAGPLDMRMDPTRGEALAGLLARTSLQELTSVLARLGEVPSARRVARRILVARDAGRLADTLDLARAVAVNRGPGRVHPATQVFLALRLWVNDELGQLEALLSRLPEPLAPGGRVVLIGFHSLEDRAVKRRLVELEGACSCPARMPVCRCGARASMRRLHRRALRPEPAECQANPRSRSARLRAAERLAA